MWAIPTGISSVLFKKKKKKSPIPESRVSETGSDPPIGSGRDLGRDTVSLKLQEIPNGVWVGPLFYVCYRRS